MSQTPRTRSVARRAAPRRTARGRSSARLAWRVLLVVAVVGVAGAAGYVWTRPLLRVEVTGAQHAPRAEVVRLAGLRVGERLFGTDDALVEDRVARHPWVRRAEATRLPGGTLRIAVEERVPVALVLDAEGRPKAYLDAAAHAMPARTAPGRRADAFDVPLVQGRVLPENLTQPAPLLAVRDLVASLATLSPDASALVSDFLVDARGDVTLRTVAAPGGGALRVRLGRGDYGPKFDALVRFWHRAVLPRPTRRYEVVDLRFAGQVVTREAETGEVFPDSLRTDSLRTDSLSRPSHSSPTPAL